MEIVSDSSQVKKSRQASTPSGLNLKSIVALVLSKWYWFVLSLAVTLSLGVLYLMKTVPVYTRTASILIKEDSNSGTANTSVDMSELGFMQSTTNLDNEIRTVKSPALMKDVVERLNLNDVYAVKEGLREMPLYNESPVLFVSLDSLDNTYIGFEFKVKGDLVTIENVNGDDSADEIKTAFGDTVNVGGMNFAVVRPRWDGSKYADRQLSYWHSTVRGMAKGLAGQLNARLASDKSSIIDISITRPSIREADDILRTLIQVYNERWIQDKNQIAVSTSRFIDERLGVIEGELGNVDSDISSYKSEHLLPDVSAASTMYMAQSSETQTAIQGLNNQISVAEMVRRELVGDSFDQPLPVNTGIVNADIESAIAKYNETVIERNRLLESTSEKNPVVKDRTQVLRTLRDNIMASLNSYIATLRTQLSNAQRQAAVTTSKIAASPNQAKYLLSVERQQKVKEQLYLFLLQKREENELTQAFTAYNTSMIEEPDGSPLPTAPARSQIMLIALAIGLLAPLAVLVIREVLDTKVRGKRDLASLTIPYLGEIPSAIKKARGLARLRKHDAVAKKIVVESQNRNAINEAFRVLRTNLEFYGTPDSTDGGTVVSVTSANPASGKTFISINLAKVLAIKGKKVVVVDLDLRKGSLSKILGKPDTGVSDYLIGKASLGEIVMGDVLDTDTLSAIGVGTVPPNPAELLSSKKLEELIEILRKEYDYVILDCPPVEIVTDALVINRLVDMTIFVIRAGLLEKDELENIQEYYDTSRYKNMSVLLNGTDIHSGYGYHRYGYHYGYHYGYGKNSYYGNSK